MDERLDAVRRAYEAFLAEPDASWELCDPAVVFHIAGHHPLSGDYTGLEEVRRYLAAVRQATAGRGGFAVTSVMGDETGERLVVELTAYHGDGPYVRTVVHKLRLRDGKLVELWDQPFDQPAEDRFWQSRVPAQRRPTASETRFPSPR